MSLSKPNSKNELKKYILSKLGSPVIDINISDEQLEIAIEDAYSFFSQYSVDAQEEKYISVKVTPQMISKKSLPTPENVQGVLGVFKTASSRGDYLFDILHNIKKDDLAQIAYSGGYGDLTSIYITQSYISQMDDILGHEFHYRHNGTTNTLYIDTDWASYFPIGSYLTYECVVILDMDEYPELYNNFLVKDLSVAYAKFQWGTNLSKFEGVQLPGGVTLNGMNILTQAQSELDTIKAEFIMKHQAPDGFFIG
jgi:hypothetical protein